MIIVIGGKFPAVGNHLIVNNSTSSQGALYRFCLVDRFKESIRIRTPAPTSPLDHSEIITMGDSFFNTSMESDIFANELAIKGNYNVHNVDWSASHVPYTHPLTYLQNINYQSDRHRILILETNERDSLQRTSTYNSIVVTSSNSANMLFFKLYDVIAKTTDNRNVEYFFKNNLLFEPVIMWLKNIRFKYFGIIDKSIGAYTMNPDMLFYQPEVEFASIEKTDNTLDEEVERMARFTKVLREKYNLDLIYVIVPDKYTIYRDYIKKVNAYDQYIPRLVVKLRKHGVHSIDLYTKYMNYRQTNNNPALYFVSDTHYTAMGKAILVDECLQEIALLTRYQEKIDSQEVKIENINP